MSKSYDSHSSSFEKNETFEFKTVSPENCQATVPKGGDAKAMLENPDTKHILVCDTGQPLTPPKEMRNPKNKEDLDKVYEWTIKNGIIDHHGIDAVIMNLEDGLERKCATKMVADYPDAVLSVIVERDITTADTHFDSDLDAVSSLFLTKALIEHQSLPPIAKSLAEHVNLADYGRLEIKDPEKYVKSLSGLFAGLKKAVLKRQSDELGPLFALPAVSDEENAEKGKKIGATFEKYGKILTHAAIQLLNSCNKLYCDNKGKLDLADIDVDELYLGEKLKTLVKEGQEMSKEEYQKFMETREKAERGKIAVTNKEGKTIEVPVVIYTEVDINPLAVTNLSYLMEDDNAIIAVYAGQNRKHGGDCYDIGIKPDTAGRFDLKFLEAPFNKAEAQKRKPLLAELNRKLAENSITEQELQQLKQWTALRQGFEYLEQGDPTVCVAGGSLLAASNSSLLDAEDFRKVIKKFVR